ncbi:MAG TPA: hypothetical protein VKB35_04965 [Ktedonobacteraceae bacterium]|nr:hypothetical protein [Ktedonobacteraceae bacterium]
MVMSERSTVVGVFTDAAHVEQAMSELRLAGFSDDEISVTRGGASTGGFLENLKSLFRGQETTTARTANDFRRMGVPEQDADFYQRELDAGRTIVLVRAGDLQQEALAILRKNGAYDAAMRHA